MAESEIITLCNLISSKIDQLRNYAADDCRSDHARTIAEGRIQQAIQIQRWIDDLFPDIVGGPG